MTEWQSVTLGQISTQRKGINYKSEDYGDQHSGHPFLTIKCFVKGGGYEPAGIKFYDGFSTKSDHLRSCDILFSVTDLTRAGDIVGSPLKVPDFGGDKPALASMDCMRIEPIAERCDKDFLFHRLMLQDVRRKMVAYSAGSTVLHLDTKKVPTITVRIPMSTKEQQKIASILTGIDTAIEKTEALIAKYQQIKAGLMHDLFTRGVTANGKLRPPREKAPDLYQETPIGWIPKEWNVNSLRGLVGAGNIINGPFGSDLLTSELKVNGVPVLYVQDIKPGYFKRVSNAHVTELKATELAFCNVRQGDVLVAKVGAPPCDSCVYPFAEKAIVTQDVIRIRPTPNVDSVYLSSLLNSPFGRKALKKIAIEGTRERVSLTEFKSLVFPIADAHEQVRVSERLTTTQTIIEKEIRNREKLRQQKLGLMSDLLSGSIRVVL
ncbi:MAG: restriction endonuclease subunit S [Gallionella sp.]